MPSHRYSESSGIFFEILDSQTSKIHLVGRLGAYSILRCRYSTYHGSISTVNPTLWSERRVTRVVTDVVSRDTPRSPLFPITSELRLLCPANYVNT